MPLDRTLGQLPTRLEIGTRSISIDYKPIREDDKTTQFLVVMSDITAELERERLEIEQRHAQKLESIGRLASGMAHEVNTPIQFVGDQTQFAQAAVGDLLDLVTRYQALIAKVEAGTMTGADVVAIRSAEAEADFGYVQQALPIAFEAALEGVRRVTQLVQALKEFGHPDPGTQQAADINAALRSTVLVAANEVKYVADTVLDLDELPAVVCNISELKQVFLNLIVNAGHAIGDLHAEARGRVGITTRVVGNDVVISIADTGCGIPESARARIFEPFFTTKTVGRGTGQGLAISRLLVDKHAGSLTFESDVGCGTTFHVRIPREPPAAVAPQ
jgi:signal transduction histidine kinase